MPQSALKYQLIAELLRMLEDEKLVFGVDQHLKLQELWAKLPEDLSPTQLKEVLCPAIASNEQQQTLFYELYEEALKRVTEVNQVVPPPPEDQTQNRLLWWIIGLGCLALGMLVVAFWPQIVPSDPVADNTPKEQRPIVFNIYPDSSTTRTISPRIREAWGGVVRSGFCSAYRQQDTVESNLGRFTLARDTLTYQAFGGLGQDTICTQMVDTAGVDHEVLFIANIQEKPKPTVTDTTPEKTDSLFQARTLPSFEDELDLLQIERPTVFEQFLAENIDWLRWVFWALTGLILGILLRYLERRRQKLVAELDSQDKPPYVWNIELEPAQDILLSEQFDRMVNTLRQRTREDHYQIDIPKTIQVTVEKAGMATLQYRQRTRPPEYVMLIDRQSGSNHRAKLFDWIYQRLLTQEVFIERYFFDGDIRNCSNEKHPLGLSLPELQYLHPNAKLLIFGHGYQMLSGRGTKLAKWTNIFQQWKQKVIFSPQPIGKWSRKENRLSALFTMLPATVGGLQYFSNEQEDLQEMPANAWREVIDDAYDENIQIEGGLIRSLQQHYREDLLKWIAACAVYPALHWDLTLYIGRLLSDESDPLLTVNNLNALTRLPWFEEGKMPPEARAVLVGYLEDHHPQLLKEVRQGLTTILAQNPPPEDSSAWDDYQLQLSLNEWLSTDDAQRKKELENDIASLMEQGVETDMVVLKYLEEPGPLDFIVPESWKKYVYQAGYSGLGAKRWVKDLRWALPLWLLLGLTSFFYVPPEGCGEDLIPDYGGQALCLDEDWKKVMYQKFLAQDAIDLEDEDSLNYIIRYVDTLEESKRQRQQRYNQFAYWRSNYGENLHNYNLDSLSLEADSLQEAYANLTFHQLVGNYFYNKGIPIANQADSLLLLNEEANVQPYLDSACLYFNRAYDQDPHHPFIRRAKRFCSGARVYVQVDENLDQDIGNAVRASLRQYGFPTFGVEKLPMSAAEVRYFFPEDSLNAAEVLEMMQDSFTLGEQMTLTYVAEPFALPEPGQIEVWIDDNQPTILTVQGIVVDSATQDPIADLRITGPKINTRTNAQGAFTFNLSQPFPQQLRLSIADAAGKYKPLIQTFALPSSGDLGTLALSEKEITVDVLVGRLVDTKTAQAITNATINTLGENYYTSNNGQFNIVLSAPADTSFAVTISAENYQSVALQIFTRSGNNKWEIAGDYLGPATTRSLLSNVTEIALTPIDTTNAIVPPDDQDNDKVPDAEDRCPTLPGDANNQGCPASFIDQRDQQVYPIVIIGDQVWMGANLNYAADSAWCYLELPEACAKLGRLYTWSAAKQACPEGWHLPTNAEWDALRSRFEDPYQALLEGGDSGFDARLGGCRISMARFSTLATSASTGQLPRRMEAMRSSTTFSGRSRR